MCEEAFDERSIGCCDRDHLIVRGGYSRSEVYIGVVKAGEHEPVLIARLEPEELADLHETVRLMQPPGKRRSVNAIFRWPAKFKKFGRSTR